MADRTYHDDETFPEWLAGHAVGVLNVAGPRESQRPGITAAAQGFLTAVFAAQGQ